MRDNEPKSLAEWLERKGNPKHYIAEGDNGSKVIAVEDKDRLSSGVTLYNFSEKEYPDGHKYFWLGSGWGIRDEYLPALRGLLNDLAENEQETRKYNVVIWLDDEDGEGEAVIGYIDAVSDYHASALLRERIANKRYPKGAWLDYVLDGKKIALDSHGRIA